MDGRYESGYIVSSAIITFYNELLEYTLGEMRDSQEYFDCIDKIKRMIIVEDEEYDKLNLKQVNYYLRRLEQSNMHTPVDDRYYERLINRKKVLKKEPVLEGNILLSSIFDSKIIIEAFKNAYLRLEAFDADSDFKDKLMEYFYTSLFTFLTSNNFIEKASLDCNFEVMKLPNIDHEKIGDFALANSSKSVFLKYISDALDFLDTLYGKNDAMLTYVALLEISRIEVMLQYVEINDINTILDKLNKFKLNEALSNVKRLVLKKKEELNH